MVKVNKRWQKTAKADKSQAKDSKKTGKNCKKKKTKVIIVNTNAQLLHISIESRQYFFNNA